MLFKNGFSYKIKVMEKYDPSKVEKKWKEIWAKTKINDTDIFSDKSKLYNLVMFPYPSGEYLHIGHGYSYSGADVYARFKRLNGFNVFEPIGYDSFGLPAENFALKKGVYPKESTESNIKHAQEQLKSFGCMFDWSKVIIASDPGYYKWTQWLFLKLYEKGLAYQKEAPINWCPKCLTVLANEQVIDGLCERCDTEVVQKRMKQWFFKITDYAKRLIKDLDKVDWPESSKIKQRNWIGESEGATVKFKIKSKKIKEDLSIEVFTTRIDTLFGGTFLIMAPDHPLIEKITDDENLKTVKQYQIKTQKLSDIDRQLEERPKTGVFTGAYAVNPSNNKEIPIWISDFVLASYGGGAVFADAHDERDFQLAKKFNILLKTTIKPVDLEDDSKIRNLEECFTGDGILYDSDQFNGMHSKEARKAITEWLSKKSLAKRTVNYRLRDWSFSRQRYWGAPIPIIYCEKCGMVPVSEEDLPVLLPDVKDFRPKGTGKGPLASDPDFVNTTCPKCGGKATRETDTMDTFVDSSFYFLRYPNSGNDKEMMNSKITKKWLPVDMYTGGAEHVTMHLLYARFITKALFDAGMINFDEPFLHLRHQGMILGPDNKKMSKSKGNVVIPDEVIKKEGADAFRIYILFMGPFDEGGPWNPQGIKGVKRFLDRYWTLALEIINSQNKENPEDVIYLSYEIEETALARIINKTIKKVGEDIDSYKFNTAISTLMQSLNEIYEIKNKLPFDKSYSLWRDAIGKFTIILSPFVPFITEEIWEKLGNTSSVSLSAWPFYDKNLIKEDIIDIVVQINGKLRGKVQVRPGSSKEQAEKLANNNLNIKKYTEGKEIIKSVFVPDKLLNIVVK